LLLQSANDSAEALAEHISGSTEKFATLMNKRAKKLGCKNTNFANPHGLYADNHRKVL
jgi:D-alanyl-D-alanine carboxypeptidase